MLSLQLINWFVANPIRHDRSSSYLLSHNPFPQGKCPAGFFTHYAKSVPAICRNAFPFIVYSALERMTSGTADTPSQ